MRTVSKVLTQQADGSHRRRRADHSKASPAHEAPEQMRRLLPPESRVALADHPALIGRRTGIGRAGAAQPPDNLPPSLATDG